ncbi:MAG: response regulator [Acidobacteriaceae bacterium]|jgi:CheY-like chemotaxis protein
MLNQKARLLVVDDEALVCRNMSIIFTALGYATRTAPNGFSALNAIRDEIPDIILSDLFMPGMSGFELLSVVRRRFPSIRVVAMSGEFGGTTLPAGVAADAFYEKGCHRPHLLLEAVEAMMRPEKSRAARFSLRSDAPIWIPTNGHDPAGEPYVTISCPECLRTFPQVLDKNAASTRNTKCAHCSNLIQYSIIHPMNFGPSAA